MDFTFEERELMAIYTPGTRLRLIQALYSMKCAPIWTQMNGSCEA